MIDGYDKKVDCKNLLVVATSNAGSAKVLEWAQERDLLDKMRAYLIEQGVFTSEFLNRFDKVLIFAPLTLEAATVIGKHALQEICKQYKISAHIELSISDEELMRVVKEVFNPAYGAREVVRAVSEYVAERVAKITLSNQNENVTPLNL